MTKPRRDREPEFARILEARLSRRQALGLGAAATSLAALGSIGGAAAETRGPSSFTFAELRHGADTTHHVARGYRADVLVRWGDPLLPAAPAWNARDLSAGAQEKQFGYNCDFIAFMPLPRGSKSSDHGLLCVNHEYTISQLMWPGLAGKNAPLTLDATQVAVEMAAHGHSVVEVRKEGNRWRTVANSRYARRITTATTEMLATGPAAGHPRLRTNADPTGTRIMGTLNNCAGGVTPWGTVLIAEENYPYYFGGKNADPAETRMHKRYGFKEKPGYGWFRHVDRFDMGKEPHEPNRFGWMVEYDPYDPASLPKKRTSLGRMRHEGAGVTLAPDGRVVLYMGDDEAFEYIYRFVTKRAFDPKNPAANTDLLDEGTLYAGRFEDDGTLRWLPLVWGEGPLTAENDFHSQADVVIEARRAGDLVGATTMDRPEDVEVNPVNGRVYAALTNNTRRRADAENPTRRPNEANPRGPNRFGHVIEMMPPGDDQGRWDHTAEFFRWDIFILAGNPNDPAVGARYNPATSNNGWLAAPDNLACDPKGRLWISTDQGWRWTLTNTLDGLYACDVSGPGRALPRLFFRVPAGAEMTGPCFTPDGRSLFVSVQHPGEAGDEDDKTMSFDTPSTRWPDFKPGIPPRPSVVAITKDDGGEIGS
ncbi:MAG: PhoX family phosphatase [Alphaproteobacteria bacterium]